MFEDSFVNAEAAKEAGMAAVFVTGETCDLLEDELNLKSVAAASSINLPKLIKAMPSLWK
jgi:beta-phosphoglucomutase-like phosphatase (HAD superfamily)